MVGIVKEVTSIIGEYNSAIAPVPPLEASA